MARPRRKGSPFGQELLTISGFDEPLPGVPKPWEQRSKWGVTLLSAVSVAGLHAAVSPSLASLRVMSKKPDEKSAAQTGLWWGLGLSLAAATGLWFLFDEKLPAYAAGVMGASLFGLGMISLSSDVSATSGLG